MAWGILVILGTLATALDGYAAEADSPALMGFQGFLTDGNGDPRGSEGPVNLEVTFRIYKNPTEAATNAVWAELQVVTVDNGHFSVILGQGTPVQPLGADRDLANHFTEDIKDGRYLGIQVGNEAEITPRIRFLAAPYAHLARYANGLVGGNGKPILATDGQGTTTLGGGPNPSRLDVRGAIAAKSVKVEGKSEFDGDVEAHDLVVTNEATFLQGADSRGALKLPARQPVQFGNTARIGLNLESIDRDTLDILGAGATGQRILKFWAEGGAAFTGNVTGQVFSGQQFVGSGMNLTGVAKLSGPNLFDGFQTINNHLQLGLITPPSGGPFGSGGSSGWGKALVFSGASVPPSAANGENTDPIWMARYNVAANQSELRVVLGNDGDSGDKWVLGTRSTDYNSSTVGNDTSWKPKFSVDANGTIELRPDLAKDANNGKIGYFLNGSNGLDIVGAGASVLTRRMYLHAQGGTTHYGPMTIDGTSSQYFTSYGRLHGDGAASNNREETWKIGLRVNGDVRANEIHIHGATMDSDVRIKNVAGRSDACADLQALVGLEVTDYTHKDKVRYGTRARKMLIAQQAERIYPLAVSRGTGVVPDLYTSARVDRGWLSISADLVTGERIQVITQDGERLCTVAEAAADNARGVGSKRYRVDPPPSDGDVFVYGREVSDFRSVDYNAIAMLNVSATQELAKQLEQQRTEMGQIRSRLSEALRANEALTQALSGRDERLARLEAKLDRFAALIEGGKDKDTSSAVVVAVSHP